MNQLSPISSSAIFRASALLASERLKSSSHDCDKSTDLDDIVEKLVADLELKCCQYSAVPNISVELDRLHSKVLDKHSGEEKEVQDLHLIRALFDKFCDIVDDNNVEKRGDEDAAQQQESESLYRLVANMIQLLLSFIGFTVLISSRYVHYSVLRASDFFTTASNCKAVKDSMNGSFNMQYYQVLIACLFFYFLRALIYVVYQLLPTNERGEKVIGDNIEVNLSVIHFTASSAYSPEEGVTQRQDDSIVELKSYIKKNGLWIELCLNGVLLSTGIVIAITSAIMVERGEEFLIRASGESIWYTLSTFFTTADDNNRECLIGNDVTSFIRSALSMTFLASFAGLYSWNALYGKYLRERAMERSDSSLFDTSVSGLLIRESDSYSTPTKRKQQQSINDIDIDS